MVANTPVGIVRGPGMLRIAKSAMRARKPGAKPTPGDIANCAPLAKRRGVLGFEMPRLVMRANFALCITRFGRWPVLLAIGATKSFPSKTATLTTSSHLPGVVPTQRGTCVAHASTVIAAKTRGSRGSLPVRANWLSHKREGKTWSNGQRLPPSQLCAFWG